MTSKVSRTPANWDSAAACCCTMHQLLLHRAAAEFDTTVNTPTISTFYTIPSSGMRHAQEIGMNMNTTILCEISYQVEHGNPQWGMLMANEYTDADSFLRKALAQRFESRLGKETAATPLNKSLLEGRTKAELAPELSAEIGARSVPTERKVPSSNLSDRLYRRRTIENNRRTSTRPLRRAA